MTQWIGGPGLALPSNGPIYPAQLFNAPPTFNTYTFTLPVGGTIPVPAGEWLVTYNQATTALEYYDAVSTQWLNLIVGSGGPDRMSSDGFNMRVRQQGLVATGGSVTAAGSGYVQATTTITPSLGNSTWMPIIGGKVGTITIDAGGTNYSKPPLVFFDSPPPPGVPAIGVAALTSGAVSSITLAATSPVVPGATAGGAGYTVAPNIAIVPDPFDPNINIITPARAHCVLTGAGTLTGVLLLNAGQAVGSAGVGYTLTVAGAGSSATAATIPVSGSWVAGPTSPAADIVILQRC
jgi:hypothetical protein